jgi:hypothetical protein
MIRVNEESVSRFNKKYNILYDVSRVKAVFDRFNKQRWRLPIKNVFGYNNIEDLLSVINQPSKREQEKHIRDKEIRIVLENNDVLVVEPLTERASFKYGANTKWCTTMTRDGIVGIKRNRFNQYFNNIKSHMIYFIDKRTKDKFVLLFGNVNKWFVAQDALANYIDYKIIFERFSLDFEKDIKPNLRSKEGLINKA